MYRVHGHLFETIRRPSRLALGAILMMALLLAVPAAAQPRPAPPDTLRLSLEEAVRIALERNPALRLSRLEVEQAEAEVREARGGLLPQLGSSAGYTREVQPVDPFAGTDASALLGGQAPTDWLAYNERARTDGDPATRPLPLPEFRERQERAFRDAGVSPEPPGRSPFSVPNQVQAGLWLSQPVYAPGAAAQLRGTRLFRGASLAGLRRQRVATVDSVRQAYLGALLAREQAAVLARSVERTEAALAEAVRRVEEGAAAVTERLAAQVEAGNLRAELLQMRLQEERARNGLRLTLGLSPLQPLLLTDPLRVDDGFALAEIPLEAALARAVERRADLEEMRLTVAAQRALVDASRALLRPSLNAVVNLNLLGNVPDDRARLRTDPLQPFTVDVERRGVLAPDFWDLGVTAGVEVQWNLYQGGQLRARSEQARVGVRRAEVQLARVSDLVQLEVEDALLEMRVARERVVLQQANAELAERNYEAVSARVRQGVATAFERREASEQLDQARLGLVQGIHDYLAARGRLLAAVGLEAGEAW